jgi:hypothetical protein
MSVNKDKPQLWKADIIQSVDLYNRWFMTFAPVTYINTRVQTAESVQDAFRLTNNLGNIQPNVLIEYPTLLPILRMVTAPPIARDRLIGLAGITTNIVDAMENNRRIPPRLPVAKTISELERIIIVIKKLIDNDICPWLGKSTNPSDEEVYRAATIVADRLCGSVSDPIIRNAQEQRQLALIKKWLEDKGYRLGANQGLRMNAITPGTFSFRYNVPVAQTESKTVNIPIDAVIMPKDAKPGDFPLLIEAKSAGDFTNTNKRRKEEAQKINQLRDTYGDNIRFILFLCGYFDSGYLGYEAAEGIDWVWEHRVDDLAEFGI